MGIIMPKDLSKYLDIINLPRHISTRRAPMSISNRAAQFAPFAALTGYESSIREAARFTEQRIEPDEDQKAAINEMLQYINRHINEQPEVTVLYFRPDERKNGGRYVTVTGNVVKFDATEKTLWLADGAVLFIENILALLYK
jgi:hypothetical protein